MSRQEVWEQFQKAENKVDILYEALDYMQQYNGREKIECIALAMGLKIDYE